MGYPVKKEDKKFNYGDYLTWPDEERWELIEGLAYDMSPAPSRMHQKITGELFYRLKEYFEDKTCEVYIAPFDVRLPEKGETDENIKTVVQPDIVVVCEKFKLDDKGCKGSPSLIIEVISPKTAQRDLKDKFFLYEKRGVKEYWIVHPMDKTVMVFNLEESGKYGRPKMYSGEDELKAGIFDSLTIDLKEVFKE